MATLETPDKITAEDKDRITKEIGTILRAKGLLPEAPAPVTRRKKRRRMVVTPTPTLPVEGAPSQSQEAVKPRILEIDEEEEDRKIKEALESREKEAREETEIKKAVAEKIKAPPEVVLPEAVPPPEVIKPPEAPPKIIYEPKYLSPEWLKRETDLFGVAGHFHFEDGEMDANRISWQTRLDFWQELLSKLEPGAPLYEEKKNALEARIKKAEGVITLEDGLARGMKMLEEELVKAESIRQGQRVKDIVFTEEISPEEAKEIVNKETDEAETAEKIRKEKLQKLGEAQAKLVAAEKRLKEYEGLAGVFKGLFKRTEKAAVELEYEEAKKEYEKVRAEFVGSNIEKMLLARMSLTDRQAQELHEKRGRIYRAWKWLGEQNIEKLMPEKFKARLASWRPEGKLGKAAKFTAHFGSKFLSLRTGLSFGLLGIGIWGGIGTATAVSLLAARRALAGIGTGFGAYDLLKRGQENWAATKWNLSWKPWEMRAGLTKEDVEKLSLEEIEERMAHFEMNAALGGHKISENKIYETLILRYKELIEKEASEKANEIEKFLEKAMAAEDQRLEKMKEKAKRNERIMKGVAVGMGFVAGSGLLAKLISGKWGWEQFAEAREVKQELRQQIDQAPEAPEMAPPVGPTEAVVTEFPVETVTEQVKLPKEFINQMAGDDRLLTPDEVTELVRLQTNLELLGLNPSDPKIVSGLGITSFEDIDEARQNLLALSQVTKEPRILQEVVARGLDEGDASNLKATLAQVEKIAPSPEIRQLILATSIENNFEGTTEMTDILKKVDAEHLKIAGIMRPDGTIDTVRLRDIANAQTITIDKKGEGIYKALRDFYSAPPEQGGLGLTGRELRAKIVEQMKNLAFYKDGKLQDLVEIGDKIKIDSQGNVLLFIALDGKMQRCRDILDLVSDRAFRSGNQIFEVVEGVRLRETTHYIDGHAVIKLTDPQGIEHTISDWSVGKTARINGKREILEEWLRKNNLLLDVRGVRPAMPATEIIATGEMRRSLQADDLNRLRDYTWSRVGLPREIPPETRAEVETLRENIGLSHEAAHEMRRTFISPTAVEIFGTRTFNILEKFFDEPGARERIGYDVNLDEIGAYSPERLADLNSRIEEMRDVMSRTIESSPEAVDPSFVELRDSLDRFCDYLEERQAILRGQEVEGVAVPEEAPPVRPELIREGLYWGRLFFPPELTVKFHYDIFGNPSGISIEGTGSSFRAKELLCDNWQDYVAENGARREVLARTLDLERRERVLRYLEKIGQGESAEAEFLRRSKTMMIRTIEEKYGDVFRD